MTVTQAGRDSRRTAPWRSGPLSVPGGSLADGFGPRVVMLGSDAVRCGLTAVLAVLAANHVASLAVLAPVAAVLGSCSSSGRRRTCSAA